MIDKKKLMNEAINEWGSYDPNLIRFAKFYDKDPSQLATGRKVVDTYHAFTTGRASLFFSLEEHFGDLAKDDDTFSKLFVRSLFVRDALLHFGLSLDLSWQTVWAYVYPSSVKDLLQDNYKKYEQDCYRENLFEQLDCCISQGNIKADRLKTLVKDFDNDATTLELRELYNFMKHRGDIAIEGLGSNNKNQGILIDGVALPTLSRREYKIENLQQLAYDYAIKFMDYFKDIVDIVIPTDYKNNNSSFDEVINAQLAMKEVLDNIGNGS